MDNSSRTAFTPQREQLVALLKREGITDPSVLAAMRQVPREMFVPFRLRDVAYDNAPLPIGHDQTISQPYIVALMTASLELKPTDRVLEIGTGSGYAAAILAQLAQEVYTVERYAELAENARRQLRQIGFANVHVLHSDGTRGWPEQAPFDAITVAAGGMEVPSPLLDQLSPGGRLVMPLGRPNSVQKLVRIRKIDQHDYREEKLADVRFVPLVDDRGQANQE